MRRDIQTYYRSSSKNKQKIISVMGSYLSGTAGHSIQALWGRLAN